MPKCPSSFAVPLPNSQVEGSTPIYRHPDCVEQLHTEYGDGVKTIWDLFSRSVRKWPKAPCHGKRELNAKGEAQAFKFTTYSQVMERVKNFASGLKDEMQPDTTGTMRLCGLMGINSSEWSIAELACLSMGGTTVPMYNTTPRETLEYLMNQNGLAVVVCDPPSAKAVLKAKPNTPKLVTMICYNHAGNADLKSQAEAAGMTYYTFEEIEAKGKANPKEFSPPTEDTVFSFVFTSGSTGMPKGALLTHKAQISVLASAFDNTEKSGIHLRAGGGEFHLSYLPSAHIMERAFQAMVIGMGGAVGYFQGKREELLSDLQTLQPTVWPSVPRLLNMIYDKIMNTVRATGGVKEKLFMKALRAKTANLKKGKMTHALWDKLVFNKLKKRLGFTRCKFIVTGSAPIAGAVLDFYRAVFGLCVVEGYGATETCASGTMTHPLYFSSEHVGGPSPNCEVKLVSLPQMNYMVTDTEHKGMKVMGRGEICVRGPCLMREYYLNPEATKKALDSDGFYHTGDVGTILPNGCFKIFDRVGNVFKLSIGEYVAPEKVENVCLRSRFVASIFAHGDALHPKMVAIVVPDEAVAKTWAKENGVADDKLASLCKNEKFRQEIIKDLDAIGRKEGLMSFEIPKDVFLESEPWTPDNILTATLKMQRKKAVEVYKSQLDAMLGAPA